MYVDDTFPVTFLSPLMINDGEYHSVKRKKTNVNYFSQLKSR